MPSKLNDKILGLFQGLLLMIAAYMASEIRDISASIKSLNVQVAVVLTKSTAQEKDIDDLKSRILVLEQNK